MGKREKSREERGKYREKRGNKINRTRRKKNPVEYAPFYI